MPAGIKLKPLLIVSGFIIISDLIFIAINYYSALNAIDSDTRRWAKEVQHVFYLTLDSKSTSMQQLASFVANIPRVQDLFHQGKTAHESNLIGHKNSTLSSIRNKLYRYVNPSWEKMTSRYDVRQLHFHFGPGSTSFLRVHRPEKFGDNMDDVRFTVVDVNNMHKPVKGFETGRVYSGIRGVVPVEITDNHNRNIHIGALEAGTSFTNMLNTLSTELDSNIAVLLSRQYIQKNMWPDFVKNHFANNTVVENFFIECSTNPTAQKFLLQKDVRKLLKAGDGAEFISGDKPIQVGVFPLRDYRGVKDFTRPHSGAVVFWTDASEKWDLLQAGLRNNIVYALIALIIVEAVLIVGWKLSQRHLNMIIKRQTKKLRKLATKDGLTGIFNRRSIEKFLEEESCRASRHGSSFSVIMFDIDHFKKVNDTYGHNAGDEVLKRTSACVANLIRTTDKVGRWGGEEFLVLAPETSSDDSFLLAERIRAAVAALDYTTAAPVTISLGCAQYQPDESAENLIQRADAALYQAKESGRNKTISAD